MTKASTIYKGSPLRIPFDTCDPGGIVFFGNYFHLAHRAFEDFLLSRDIPWKDWFASKEWAVPLRHAEADYLKPLFGGQTYAFEVELLRMGESSLQIQVSFFDAQGQTCSRIRTTHVFVGLPQMTKRPIPEPLRSKLIV